MGKNNYKYFGLFGFFGFLGVLGILNNDPLQMLWMIWFLWFLYFFYKPKKNKKNTNKENIIRSQDSNKKENMRKLVKFLEKSEKVRNNDVEDLLGVSDATATRYLEELEMGGMIEQVGESGSGVYYIKK